MLTQFLFLPVLYFIVADIDRLIVDAEPAVATISVQESGRRLIRLPELEFPLRIRARCARGGEPESISISVADTRRTLLAEELRSAETIETSVKVSARQIAPLALQEFCIAGEAAEQSTVLGTALTAQVSLRCVLDDDRWIVFDVAPLDIRVNCDGGGELQPD